MILWLRLFDDCGNELTDWELGAGKDEVNLSKPAAAKELMNEIRDTFESAKEMLEGIES